MADQPVGQGASEECTTVFETDSSGSLSGNHIPVSEIREEEPPHVDLTTDGSVSHPINGTDSSETDKCSIADHPSETKDLNETDSSAAAYTTTLQESDAIVSPKNDGVQHAESENYLQPSTPTAMEENESTTFGSDEHAVSLEEKEEVPDPTKEVEKTDEVENDERRYPMDKGSAFSESRSVEPTLESDGMPSDTPVRDSLCNELSPIQKECSDRLARETEQDNLVEQLRQIESTTNEDAMMEVTEVSQTSTLLDGEKEQVIPTDTTIVNDTEHGESYNSPTNLELTEVENPDTPVVSTLGAAGEQMDKTFNLSEEELAKEEESANIPDREEVSAGFTEHQLSEVLAAETRPDMLQEETVTTSETNANQEERQAQISDVTAEHLYATNDAPYCTGKEEAIAYTSPQIRESSESLNPVGDPSGIRDVSEGLETAKETPYDSASVKQATVDTPDRLNTSSEDTLAQSKSTGAALSADSSAECENAARVCIREPVYSEETTDRTDDEPPAESAREEATDAELQTEAEHGEKVEEQGEPIEDDVYDASSETKLKEDKLKDKNEDDETPFDASVEHSNVERPDLVQLDSSIMDEHSANEHEDLGYSESEAELRLDTTDMEKLRSLDASQNSIVLSTAVIVDSTGISPLREWNKPDGDATESSYLNQTSSFDQAFYAQPEVLSQISVSSSAVQDAVPEFKENVEQNHSGETKLAKFVEATHPADSILEKNEYMKGTKEMSPWETKQRSRTLDSALMSSWTDAYLDPKRRAATLGRDSSHRRPKLRPKPAINDDHLFPDSVTPSKVDRELSVKSLSEGLPEGTYDVPYIDDDAFLPRNRRDRQNRGALVNGSEHSSEEGDWNWSNERTQNELLVRAHIADVNECVPTPELIPKQQRASSKRKGEKDREFINGKKAKSQRKRKPTNLCSCVGRQSRT